MVVLGLLACEPMSGTDKERGREEMRELLAERAKWGESRRKWQESKREFALRFVGRVQPGVGCGVCPDMCKNADLRQVPVPELHRMYREAALQFGYPEDDRMYQIAGLELDRLACIAKDGGPAMQKGWLPLLDGAEDPAVRYAAAVQAIQHGLPSEPAFRVLEELAAGSSKFVVDARIVLDEWKLGITPSL